MYGTIPANVVMHLDLINSKTRRFHTANISLESHLQLEEGLVYYLCGVSMAIHQLRITTSIRRVPEPCAAVRSMRHLGLSRSRSTSCLRNVRTAVSCQPLRNHKKNSWISNGSHLTMLEVGIRQSFRTETEYECFSRLDYRRNGEWSRMFDCGRV